MKQRSEYRVGDITAKPGVYIFRDELRQVIYVGKAKSLRKRLSSYFQPSRQRTVDPKLRSLINSIAWFETHEVRTENEAMLLESQLIKKYAPRYNVVLRDDKRYLLVKLDVDKPFPRLTLARLRKDDGCKYYGPFPHAGVLRQVLDFLTQHFGLRSCSPERPGVDDHKHCLNDVVRFCKAPCLEKVTEEEYRLQIESLMQVLEGKTSGIATVLEERMRSQAEAMRFEKAAQLRDMIDNIQTVFGARNRTFSQRTLEVPAGMDAVVALQKALDLADLPTTIECFDNSNLQGASAVSSMVCFKNGVPAKADYRHYRVKTVVGANDFATMTEMVDRRYSRLLGEEKELPQLVVIDGGLGQLHAAYEALVKLELDGLPIIGLAKRNEEIFTIFSSEPIILERHDPALRLVQAMRDEAHRFAITFHRSLRRNRILNSLLDEISGIGEKRKKQILTAFGSVRNLRRHDSAELAKRVPGIGPRLAETIMSQIKRSEPKK
ncbi:MAG TPA: excinuclease ABC subunit C [Lentisphaeria bacterium]|nr:excinuclease ABC subunit C [Lentisphaeria bacterium]